MHTEKMKTKFGNDSKDQVIVHKGDRKVFVSYGTPIAEIAGEVVTLDEDYWDYSATTGQYRNEFLGEGIADTRKKIKDGTYHLTNLVYTDDDWDRVEWKDDMWCPIVSVDLVEDGPINWPNAGAEAAREVEDDKDDEDRQGIHTKTYPNGATYRGHYLNDKRHGVGIKTHADGTNVYSVYEHGVKVGGYL